jgi:transcriptional regulator with XRE-family HTH domain
MTTLLRDDPQFDDLAKMLGKLIETERKRVGLTQEDLAERMGVSQNAVTGWERAVGQGALHLITILTLEDVFALPRSALLQRLGLLASHQPDFEAVVLANLALTPRQKNAIIDVYRAMTTT